MSLKGLNFNRFSGALFDLFFDVSFAGLFTGNSNILVFFSSSPFTISVIIRHSYFYLK